MSFYRVAARRWRKRAGRVRRAGHAVALRLRPRALKDLLKRGLHAVGLLVWYWRLRAFMLAALRPLSPWRLAATVRFWRRLRVTLATRRAEPRLTVAVDVTPFWEPLTGIGWYLYRLLEQLADRDDVRLRLYGPNLVSSPDLPPPAVPLPTGRALEEVRYSVSDELALSYVRLVGWLRQATPRLIAADGNAVLFAPNYFLPTWFSRAGGHLVATVHDLSFLRVPWTMRESTRRDLEIHLRDTVARATLVLTDAETVRGELIEERLADAEQVRAVLLGPGAATAAAAGVEATLPEAVPARYVLHVGTLEPRKDLPTLLDAHQALCRRWPETPPLVLCGRFGWKTETLADAVAAGEDDGRVIRLGYLDDAVVAALYRQAQLVVMPSIYEGFGLPAVEAMHLGAPLLVSDIPVLREVAGDAAHYAPPGDVEAWGTALERLLRDDPARAVLAARGSLRARRFEWRRTAEETLIAWRFAAGQRTEVVTSPRAESPQLRDSAQLPPERVDAAPEPSEEAVS